MTYNNFLEAFIITNNRESFSYCYKSVEQQSIKLPIKVIEGMSFVDANNKALKDCRSQFYFRIDDDFILNKHAFAFMYKTLKNHKKNDNTILYGCRLWEDFTKKVIKGLKVYNTSLTRKLGKFKANNLGKIDKIFKKRVDKSKFGSVQDRMSVVGIHACATWEEQLRYEQLWTNNAKVKHKKTTRASMKKYGKDLPYQYELSGDFLINVNKKRKSSFYKFLRKKEKEK
tara:strand:- start:21803 stop:22486 length:684 start_codon:yes stop_codon:yes gene_type:complete